MKFKSKSTWHSWSLPGLSLSSWTNPVLPGVKNLNYRRALHFGYVVCVFLFCHASIDPDVGVNAGIHFEFDGQSVVFRDHCFNRLLADIGLQVKVFKFSVVWCNFGALLLDKRGLSVVLVQLVVFLG